MKPADVRKFSSDDASLIYERAKAGDKDAIMGFFYYSVWRSILKNPLISDKETSHEVLMQRIGITVE